MNPGLENEHGGSVGSSLSENVESDQGDVNAGSNLGEDVGSNQGNDTTWGRPHPRFEELLPDSDSEVEDTEVEDHPIVEQVVLFGEIANAVADPDGLVDAINEQVVDGYHILTYLLRMNMRRYRAIVVPSSQCSKGIAEQGTELIAWNDPPEYLDIVTQKVTFLHVLRWDHSRSLEPIQ